MTVTLSISGRQLGPGSPVAIAARLNSTDTVNDTYPDTRLGTTNSSTPPATFAALAHSDVAEFTTAIWDAATDNTSATASGGVTGTNNPGGRSFSVLKRLDANYAAGKYLWFLGFASPAPAGGDAPTQVAGPFLIA